MRVRGWFVVIGRRGGSDAVLFSFNIDYFGFGVGLGVGALGITLDFILVLIFGRELVYSSEVVAGVMVACMYTRGLGLG